MAWQHRGCCENCGPKEGGVEDVQHGPYVLASSCGIAAFCAACCSRRLLSTGAEHFIQCRALAVQMVIFSVVIQISFAGVGGI
ncbi:hypothetical protein ZWY2020_020854 [Hordeum vulgare]|nr:hypothetical protein ZWY2020_020854 [Hordeum vulgare]